MGTIDHSPNRAGHSHRKLSTKMKRKLRREKKKARAAGYTVKHYCERTPNKRVDVEAKAKGMERPAYINWKSCQPARPPKRKPVLVYVKTPEQQNATQEVWQMFRRAPISYAESEAR